MSFDILSKTFHNESMNIRTRFQKGFTLIELLVVISIIAILIALGTVSYNAAQKKARDARRQGDIKAWADAMEQYYADNNSVYPATCTPGVLYLQGGVPTDPKNVSPNVYSSSCLATGYCLCAYLESGTGNSSLGATDAACPGLGAKAEGYYCVKNQQ